MKKVKVKKISKRKQLKQIEKHLPKSYRPISGWGYFWRAVLYAIPVIGWIVLLVNALGSKNRNGRNFARSYFCALLMLIIVAVVGIVVLFVLQQVSGAPVIKNFVGMVEEFARAAGNKFFEIVNALVK